MRKVVVTGAGSVDKLKMVEEPDPTPGAGELRIRVKASGVNFADILGRRGLYPDAPAFPFVIGYEVSGIVDQVGDDVDSGLMGQEVISLTAFGGYADTAIVRPEQVFSKPKKLDFVHAAAIPVQYLTAYQLVVIMGGLKKGETILIHNAGGGVGLAALDFARHIGAKTIGTASPGKHDFLKNRGIDEVIDYRHKDWFSELMELTDGRGADLIIDPIGGKYTRQSYKALASAGRLGVFGASAVTESKLAGKLGFLKLLFQTPLFHPFQLMNANKGVFGVNLGHLWADHERVRRWGEEILRGVEAGWVNPHVDTTFPLEKVGEAHSYIEARRNIGKVVLTVGSESAGE